MGAGSGSIRDTASAHDYPSLTISDDMSFEFGQELEGVTTYGKLCFLCILIIFILSCWLKLFIVQNIYIIFFAFLSAFWTRTNTILSFR